MCLMLAGLRGIDEDIWKAARVDGIPMWKTYLFIVIPMMRPVFITTLVIIASGIVKLYDLVVAQTSGGPGIASEVPAKYVYDYMFRGAEPRPGLRRLDDDAAHRARSSSCPGPTSNSEASSVANADDACRRSRRPTHRPRPSRAARGRGARFSRAQHHPLRHADRRRASTTCCRST